jgi:hypothetical protein
MSLDIEYPLPGDVIGPSFRAGGDYSTIGIFKLPDMQPVVTTLALPSNARVRCILRNASGGAIRAESDDLSNAPNSGTWEVAFNLAPGTAIANPCSIEATFLINEVMVSPTDTETTINVTVGTTPALNVDAVVIGMG